jgi:xanthine dehydrogenase YagR molybdenum-binding subunit
MTGLTRAVIGAPLDRVDGRDKVMGRAEYASEQRIEGVAYAAPVAATIAKGAVRTVDAAAALAVEGVIAVL